jgi:hypothetical protein
MKSYSVLRLCGQILSVVSGFLLAATVAFTVIALFMGNDISGAGDEWIKLIIVLGLGQSFVAIADSAERIAGDVPRKESSVIHTSRHEFGEN